CSWCWGMSAAVEEAVHILTGEVAFDLLLGGINTHGSQPIGEYGRRHLLHIWREVRATTGQEFGMVVPRGLIYNSTLACIAIEAVRRRHGRPPFGFLHRLQQCLFVEGRDISRADVLARIAEEFEWPAAEFIEALNSTELHSRVKSQFASSRGYGTSALPSVLIEQQGRRRLLFGGYADSPTMIELIRAAAVPDDEGPEV
ncbi:MAG: DsbA family protein, partial [Pseudomonadales bacterium]|nr:DsbA family protein [Pseudomonadales bacterium]